MTTGRKVHAMQQFKLANILLEDTRQYHEAPCLYVRSSSFVIPVPGSDAWSIGPGAADFTTFFNALSVAKWREYTVCESFGLHLELRGAACAVELTRAGRLDTEPEPVAGSRRELGASAGWRGVDLAIEAGAADVLAGFRVEAEGEVELRGSYYYAEVDEASVRDVELAIATTTFRKEDYVTRNIRLVRDKILSSPERAASHITMHVVDNGRTLDAGALSGGGVFVHPNDNVGGAGGFARGMMEAMAQDVPATHVLLMDDDVEVSPESILRTWNLLALARDEWADAFVAGAMMTANRPDLRWEDLGFVTEGGFHLSVKPKYYVSNFREAIFNETIKPHLDSSPSLSQRYAAWWYCCIPTSTIEREGLPLPLFVRYDDVEYSLRCKPRFITMNGICIWHDDFTARYNAAVERYQTMRNCFIMQATSNGAPLSDFIGHLQNDLRVELAKFNYTDAQLIVDGFEDFLKGPGFYAAPGVAERTYLDANRRREKLLPYDELRETALADIGVDIDDYDFDEIVRDIPIGITARSRIFNVVHTQLFERSINGQLFGDLKSFGNDFAVVDAAGWAISYGKIFGVNTIIVIDPYTKRGAIRHRDNDACKRIWNRAQADIDEYVSNRDQYDRLYRESKEFVTSPAFWKQYLGME